MPKGRKYKYTRKRYLKLKAHENDIDFRSRQKRKLDWQKDLEYWISDLSKRPENITAQKQLELLYVFYDAMVSGDDIQEWVELEKSSADTSTDEGAAIFRLCSAIQWYIT